MFTRIYAYLNSGTEEFRDGARVHFLSPSASNASTALFDVMLSKWQVLISNTDKLNLIYFPLIYLIIKNKTLVLDMYINSQSRGICDRCKTDKPIRNSICNIPSDAAGRWWQRER